jgi:hypothetical protein
MCDPEPMRKCHLDLDLKKFGLAEFFGLRDHFAISGKFGTNLQFLEKGLENTF